MNRRTFLLGTAAAVSCITAPAPLPASTPLTAYSAVRDSKGMIHVCWNDPVTGWIKYGRFTDDGQSDGAVETVPARGPASISIDRHDEVHIACVKPAPV